MYTKLFYFADYDGAKFEDAKECEKYENIVSRVLNVLTKHMCGKTDVTHAVKREPSEVRVAYKSFMEICSDVIPAYKYTFMQCAEGQRDRSHASRILLDYSEDFPILYEVGYRFSCTNFELGIEYPQAYYVTHPLQWEGEIDEIASGVKQNN